MSIEKNIMPEIKVFEFPRIKKIAGVIGDLLLHRHREVPNTGAAVVLDEALYQPQLPFVLNHDSDVYYNGTER